MWGQVGAGTLLLLAVAGVGLPVAARVSERLALPLPTRAALVPLSGLAYVGVVTFVLGHLNLLGGWVPFALAGLGLAVGWVERPEVRRLVRLVAAGAWVQMKAHPVQVITVLVGFCLAVVAAAAPPNRVDEVEYHWPAPLAWAANGGWNDSPFRHVDGFPFMEIIYTAAATQDSYVAAHWLHLLTLPALGLAAAGAARALGVRGTAPVTAAAMAMPVVWDGAYAAYNDTAVGAYATAAVAVILGARRSWWAALLTAGGLLAVATSIKPTAVTAFGVVGLIMLQQWLPRRKAGQEGAARLLVGWAVLGGIALGTMAFWSLRQLVLAGHLVDPTLSQPPSADALSRLPSDTQQLIAPVMPFVTGVIGAQEPWGGRTSLVVQVFLIPCLLYVVWKRGDVLRRFSLLAVPAFAHWVVLGLVNVRTRFHIVSWVLLVGSVRIVVEDAGRRYPRRLGRWLEAAWAACVVLGVADVSVEMIRLICSTWF